MEFGPREDRQETENVEDDDFVEENFKNQRLSMSFNESPRVSRVSKAPIAKHHRSASLVETQDLLDVTKDSE